MPKMIFVVSSNIEAVGFDKESMELHVRFLSSGETYVYSNIQEHVFEGLMRAPSKGSFLNRAIKGSYQYRKL